MDELLYEKLHDEEYNRGPSEEYEPTARQEALADIERETMNHIRIEW